MDARHTAISRGTFSFSCRGVGQVSETVAQEGVGRKVSLREELTARRKAMTPDIIDGQRLYQLVRQAGPVKDRTFEIKFLDAGAQAYAFTFG